MKRNNTFYIESIINYLFIFYAINHPILSNFILKFDSIGYILMALALMSIILNCLSYKRILVSKPYCFWAIWTLYAFVNYYFRGPSAETLSFPYLFRYIFIPYICLLSVSVEVLKNSDRLMKWCAITLCFYSFTAPFYDIMLFVDSDGTRSVLGNSYAITTFFTLFFILILAKRRKIGLPFSITLIILLLFILASTGTRKAFYSALVLLLFYIYSFLNFKRVTTYLIIPIITIIVIIGYQYVSHNTRVGERMEQLEEQGRQELPSGAPDFLVVFGDRASHYYFGWQQFLEKPLFGIGVRQTRIPGYYMDAYVHSEYMAQLDDNGIIGFILFILFYIGVLRVINSHDKTVFTEYYVFLGGFIAMCFMNLTTWSWDTPVFFVTLGLMSSYSPKSKIHNYA